MSFGLILQIATLLVVICVIALGCVIVIARAVRNVIMGRFRREEAAVRPLLVRALADADETTELTELNALTGHRRKVATRLAWNMLVKVRGTSRVALTNWLVESGAVAKEARKVRRGLVARRGIAAERLGDANWAASGDDIAKLLKARHLELREVGARSLGKLGAHETVREMLNSLEHKRSISRAVITMALIHMGPSIVGELEDSLMHKSAAARRVSASMLGLHGAYGAVRSLLLILESDPLTSVRIAAANALGRIGAPQALTSLVRSAAATQPKALRIAAIDALGLLGHNKAIPDLQLALADADAVISERAAIALSKLGQEGIKVLDLVSEMNDVSAMQSSQRSRPTQTSQGMHATEMTNDSQDVSRQRVALENQQVALENQQVALENQQVALENQQLVADISLKCLGELVLRKHSRTHLLHTRSIIPEPDKPPGRKQALGGNRRSRAPADTNMDTDALAPTVISTVSSAASTASTDNGTDLRDDEMLFAGSAVGSVVIYSANGTEMYIRAQPIRALAFQQRSRDVALREHALENARSSGSGPGPTDDAHSNARYHNEMQASMAQNPSSSGNNVSKADNANNVNEAGEGVDKVGQRNKPRRNNDKD